MARRRVLQSRADGDVQCPERDSRSALSESPTAWNDGAVRGEVNWRCREGGFSQAGAGCSPVPCLNGAAAGGRCVWYGMLHCMTARDEGKRRHVTLQYVTFHMDGLVGRWKGERPPGQWLQSHADASIQLPGTTPTKESNNGARATAGGSRRTPAHACRF